MSRANFGSILTAVITTIATLGDTILYSVLPVFADELGVSDFWIGTFLSINRFARLLFHGIVATLIIKYGLRMMVMLSSIAASFSTLLYYSPGIIWLFLIARIIWGVAYSVMRQATIYYAASVPVKKKEAFAISHSLKAIGPILILLIGPYIFEALGYSKAFIFISLISGTAILIALFLPEISVSSKDYSFRNVIKISPINALTFTVSFIADGVLVVILSLILTAKVGSSTSLLFVVSAFLLLKRVFAFLLPLGLLLSYRKFSVSIHFYAGLTICIVALVLIVLKYQILGLILIWIGSTAIQNTLPLLGLENKNLGKLEVATSVTLWWDIGKAFGAFLGILLYNYFGGEEILLLLGLLLFLSTITYLYHERTQKNILT